MNPNKAIYERSRGKNFKDSKGQSFVLYYLDPTIIAVEWYGKVGGVCVESEGGVEEAVRGHGQELD